VLIFVLVLIDKEIQMQGLLKVWLWDYGRTKYSLAHKTIELGAVPPKQSELRIEYKTVRVHDVIFDISSNSFEIICIDVDDENSPNSYESEIRIYRDKLGFQMDSIDSKDDNILFREYCFPAEGLNGKYGAYHTLNKVYQNVLMVQEKIKINSMVSLFTLVGMGILIGKII
jgi:hypothetical protein